MRFIAVSSNLRRWLKSPREHPAILKANDMAKIRETEITQTKLREILIYDPETGMFAWRHKHGRACSKPHAGAMSTGGYIRISVGHSLYAAHRLAWIYVNGAIPPGLLIDHINRIRTDNRISNLRLATMEQNLANSAARGGRSGCKGVYWCADKKSWRARMMREGRMIHIGRFKDVTKARDAYLKAVQEYQEKFAQN